MRDKREAHSLREFRDCEISIRERGESFFYSDRGPVTRMYRFRYNPDRHEMYLYAYDEQRADTLGVVPCWHLHLKQDFPVWRGEEVRRKIGISEIVKKRAKEQFVYGMSKCLNFEGEGEQGETFPLSQVLSSKGTS